MNLTPADFVITTGSQQALYIIGDVLVDPGDIVIAANPSYFVYTGTLQSLGAKVMTVPMDENGMDVEAVDRLLAQIERAGNLHRVKFIYAISYFDNPTGLTMSAERRPRLLEIAKKYSKSHRILILEDAAYRELRYDGDALPSIKSYDKDNKHTILACLAPPNVRTKARFMHVHRLCTWADQGLKLSPAGGAKAGSTLARLRACLDELPACKALITRFRADAAGLLACQKILKTQGLSHDTLAQCEPLIDAIPSAALRREFPAYLTFQLETAKTLGLGHVGLPISSDTIASLFGVAKHHGVGQTQDAARIALRLPALCGPPTREEAQQVLAVSGARQHEITGQFSSLTKQRREVLCHPERLESLGMTQGNPHVELLPSPKKRANCQEIINISNTYQNPYGPQLACRDEPLLIENAAPPGIGETALAF